MSNSFTPSKELVMEAIGVLAELRDAAAGIKEELEELGFIREELEGIKEAMAPPSPPRPAVILNDPPEGLESYAKALQLVRAALDSDAGMGSEDIVRLHEAEELLSRELGNPIWEGRRP